MEVKENIKINIITEDGITIEIDKRIELFSKLFHHILSDYESEITRIYKINSKELYLIIDFCEILNYDYTIINLPKPLMLKSLAKIKLNLFKSCSRLEKFYESLNSSILTEYSKIADFYDLQQLEDLIYLKLYDVFQSKETIDNFFENELLNSNFKHMNNKINDLNEERIEYLKKRYMIYCEKFVNNLTDEQVEILLENEFNF